MTAKAKASPARTAAKGKAKPKAKRATPAPTARKAAPKTKKSAAKPKPATKSGANTKASASAASRHIDERIASLGDWRGETLARMRALILEADAEILEEVKWGGTPVWSKQGILCTGETYKQAVKLTFARGAALPDPARLFNSSLEGNTRRAIDIAQGQKVNTAAFKALVKAAVALNESVKKKR